MKRPWILVALLLLSACSSPTGEGDGGVDPTPLPDDGSYYVALDGSDTAGDGSVDSPWRTIGFAAATVPASGGFSIQVEAGIYDGPISIERGFDEPVIFRSQEAYGATLSHVSGNETILYMSHQGSMRVVIEGFVISNEGTTRNPCASPAGHMIQVTNASDVTFRNNVIYGNDRMPRCNEAIKINLDNAQFFPTGIRFEGNLLSSPPAVGGREMIDIFEPGELDIVDNIFVSSRGGGEGEAFVRLWGEWGSTSARSPRYQIQRNVFMNYEGNDQKGFIEFGGEGASIYEISDALIENNLFVSTADGTMAAPLVLRGVQDVMIRANSFVGPFQANALALHLGSDGANPISRRVDLVNNIWSDPSANQPEAFVSTYGAVDTSSLLLDHNVFWNGTGPLPGLGAITPVDDDHRIVADPMITAIPAVPTLPVWYAANRRFVSGSHSVREEFERLVSAYGVIASNSPARDVALADNMPAEDILGFARDGQPDIGAVEAR